MSEVADDARPQKLSWRGRVYRYKSVIIMSLAEWHGRLLKGFIDYSTRTIPVNLKKHIKAATEPGILYNPEKSDLDNSNILRRMPKEVSQLRDNIDEWRSIYGDEEETNTTQLQVREGWRICEIIRMFGFPSRHNLRRHYFDEV